MKAVGFRIKQARERLKLSQEDTAARANMAARSLQRLEAGEGNPTLETLISLATALETSLDALAGLHRGEPSKQLTHPHDVSFAVKFLAQFESLDHIVQQYVLALVFDDERYIDQIDLRQAWKTARKSL